MKTILFAAAALLATPAFAGPGTIIAPTSATIDVGGPGFGSIANTYNQAGLSSGYVAGVTNFDAYIATNPTHTSTFACCEWFSNSGTTGAQVTYMLGATKTINALALWNEESSGIGRLLLSGSLDGITFTTIGLYSPIDNPLASYPAEVFSFANVGVKFVRFEMSGCPQPNPGTFPGCAIGEVAFRAGAVPEPTTWGLMIAGFGLVGATLRRRRDVVVAA